MPEIQPCKICNGSGTVTCPNQQCAHWCPCTVCDGTGKVEIISDWSQGHEEVKVRPGEYEPVRALHKPVVKIKKPGRKWK